MANTVRNTVRYVVAARRRLLFPRRRFGRPPVACFILGLNETGLLVDQSIIGVPRVVVVVVVVPCVAEHRL